MIDLLCFNEVVSRASLSDFNYVGVKIVLYSTRLRPKGINKLGIRTDQYSYFFKSVLYSEVALY